MPPDAKTPRSAGARPPGGPGQPGDHVYFEIVAQGNVLRVTAIDEKTGIEATILGPAGGSRAALEQAALNKLRYLMRKEAH